MRTLLLLAAAIGSFAAESSPALGPKEGAEALDAVSILVQRQPTSGDGKPGIFRMQGGVQGAYTALRDADDVLDGSADVFLPIVDGRMAIRFAVPFFRYEVGEHTDLGFGDLGIRWDWVPAIAGPNALLVEVDTTWDTASRDRLGYGTHTIAPAVAYAIPLGKGLSVMPAVDHRFNWGGDDDRADISLTRFHAYGTWAGDGRFWVQADLAMDVDHESDDSWTSLDVLGGMRVGKAMSAWVRPGFALGDERPYDVRVSGGVDIGF